jgi:NitT/TauT family transport system ATP-binding protein
MSSLAPPLPTSTAWDAPALRPVEIACRDVGFVYQSRAGSVTALEHVSLRASGSEFVSIVGPSGCGKSTLLRLIAGLQDATSGSLAVSGGEVGARVGGNLVFQEHGTFPWMTVLENLAFGLEIRGVPRKAREEQALDFAHRLGLAGFVRHYPTQLSVGMRQRVQIGRAFLSDSPILLMDEPFGALDVQTRWTMQEELLRIWSANRKLVVFVTHDLDEAAMLSDRILVMSGRPGTIAEEIRVPIQRPRDLQRDGRAIRDISLRIWQHLRDEVREGLGIVR